MFRITVTLLKSPDQRSEHIWMYGLVIHQLLGTHSTSCVLNDIGYVLACSPCHTYRILDTSSIKLPYLVEAIKHFLLTALTAQCNEIGISSANIICPLGEASAYNIRKCPDLLVSRLITKGTVNCWKTIYITYGNSYRESKVIFLFYGKTFKALPFLESGKHICLQSNIGEYKHLPKFSSLFIVKPPNITSEGTLLIVWSYITLKWKTVILRSEICRQVVCCKEIPEIFAFA